MRRAREVVLATVVAVAEAATVGVARVTDGWSVHTEHRGEIGKGQNNTDHASWDQSAYPDALHAPALLLKAAETNP